jgi:copper oxidase (laccase) domain-containing protein
MGVCTFEDERLFSHRRDKGRTGGMAAFLRLVPEQRNRKDG